MFLWGPSEAAKLSDDPVVMVGRLFQLRRSARACHSTRSRCNEVLFVAEIATPTKPPIAPPIAAPAAVPAPGIL